MGPVTPDSLVLQIFLFHRTHNSCFPSLLIIQIPQFNLWYVQYTFNYIVTRLSAICQRNFHNPYSTPNPSAPPLYPTPPMLPPAWTARYPSQTASAPPPESHTPSSMSQPLSRPLDGKPCQPPLQSTIAPHYAS